MMVLVLYVQFCMPRSSHLSNVMFKLGLIYAVMKILAVKFHSTVLQSEQIYWQNEKQNKSEPGAIAGEAAHHS